MDKGTCPCLPLPLCTDALLELTSVWPLRVLDTYKSDDRRIATISELHYSVQTAHPELLVVARNCDVTLEVQPHTNILVAQFSVIS